MEIGTVLLDLLFTVKGRNSPPGHPASEGVEPRLLAAAALHQTSSIPDFSPLPIGKAASLGLRAPPAGRLQAVQCVAATAPWGGLFVRNTNGITTSEMTAKIQKLSTW